MTRSLVRRAEPASQKRSLSRKPSEKARTQNWRDGAERLLIETPRGFKWKGAKTPKHVTVFHGNLAVEAKNMPPSVPKFHDNMVPDTFWLVYPDTGHFRQMITVLPGTSIHGWTDCGRCRKQAPLCTCTGGLIHDKGIEFCYITALAHQNKDELHGHAQGKTDVTHPGFVKYALYHYRRNVHERPSKASGGPGSTGVGVGAKRVLKRPQIGSNGRVATTDSTVLDAKARSTAQTGTETLKRTLTRRTKVEGAAPAKRTLTRRK